MMRRHNNTMTTLPYDPRPISRDHLLVEDRYYSITQQQQQYPLQQPKRSYGIICVSREGEVLMNESPSYFTQTSHYKPMGKFSINSNIRNNLLFASFPHGTSEGQYGFPKGRIDAIDCGCVINTKIREFIEETRCYHPILLKYATHHYRNPKYISPFTDNLFQVEEEWVGLDNLSYWVQYTIIIIPSLDELIFLGDGFRTRNFILKEIPVIANANSKIKKAYRDKFHFGSRVDNQKRTVRVTLDKALLHLNCHKLLKFNTVSQRSIFDAYKKYKSQHRILSL